MNLLGKHVLGLPGSRLRRALRARRRQRLLHRFPRLVRRLARRLQLAGPPRQIGKGGAVLPNLLQRGSRALHGHRAQPRAHLRELPTRMCALMLREAHRELFHPIHARALAARRRVFARLGVARVARRRVGALARLGQLPLERLGAPARLVGFFPRATSLLARGVQRGGHVPGARGVRERVGPRARTGGVVLFAAGGVVRPPRRRRREQRADDGGLARPRRSWVGHRLDIGIRHWEIRLDVLSASARTGRRHLTRAGRIVAPGAGARTSPSLLRVRVVHAEVPLLVLVLVVRRRVGPSGSDGVGHLRRGGGRALHALLQQPKLGLVGVGGLEERLLVRLRGAIRGHRGWGDAVGPARLGETLARVHGETPRVRHEARASPVDCTRARDRAVACGSRCARVPHGSRKHLFFKHEKK